MSERFFDSLARTLASPMPRRRALRLAGAALVAAAVPGFAPRAASAAGSDCGTEQNPCSKFCKKPGEKACGRESTNDCGQVGCSLQGCYKVATTDCCRAGDEAPWFCPKGTCGKVRPECPCPTTCKDGTCCPRSKGRCVNGKCCPAIRTTFRPGSSKKAVACCPPGTVAVPGGVGLCCPKGKPGCCDAFDPRADASDLAPLGLPKGKVCVNGKVRNA